MKPKSKGKEGNPAYADSAKNEPMKTLASLERGNKPLKGGKKAKKKKK